MDKQEQTLDLLVHGLDELSGVIKLQFGMSTGAVALFVHAIFEGNEGPLLAGILSAAAICFGASAIMCLNALADFGVAKTGMAIAISGASGTPAENTEMLKGRFKQLSKGYGTGAKFFYAGVIFSVALLVAEFAMELALKFSHR